MEPVLCIAGYNDADADAMREEARQAMVSACEA
jgi:hypothetical protein